MKILYFGDVYSKPGRNAVYSAMQRLVPEHQIDYVVLNGENVTHGNGILPEMAAEIRNWGVDVITTGNHVWDHKQIIPFMNQVDWIIRPANYPDPPQFPSAGRGWTVAENRRKLMNRNAPKLGVIQVMGRVFMDSIDCPFLAADRALADLRSMGIHCVLVDFHGEASSEKQAFAHYMDGRVGAVVGSHSHVQTADERILRGGTAAITDVGMSGCFDSVIGVKKELSIEKFLTKRKVKYEPAEGPGGYGCVVIDLDDRTGLARSILRIRKEIAD